MLLRTRHLAVVFTPAYPALALFAERHFSPDHPLRYSPLWLDENDWEFNENKFRKLRLPSPLKLDYAAHARHSSLEKKKYPNRPALPPICDMNIEYPMWYTNADQVMLKRQWGRESRFGACEEDSALRAHLNCLACTNPLAGLAVYDEEASNEGTSSSSFFSPAGSFEREEEGRDGVLESVFRGGRSVASYFPAVREGVMMNAFTGMPYAPPISKHLLKIQERQDYRSQWWASTSQWKNMGAFLKPDCGRPHRLSYIKRTKLIHISLIQGALDLLQHSFISWKTRLFICFLPKERVIFNEYKENQLSMLNEVSSNDGFFSLSIQEDMKKRYDQLEDLLLPGGLTESSSSTESQSHTVHVPSEKNESEKDEAEINKKSAIELFLPLYLNSFFIEDSGAVLKNDAVPLLTTKPSVPQSIEHLAAPPPPSPPPPTQAESVEPCVHRLAHSSCGVGEPLYFYHISDLRTEGDEPFEPPTAVLDSLLQHCTPIHHAITNEVDPFNSEEEIKWQASLARRGTNAEILPFVELEVASLRVHHPRLLSVLQQSYTESTVDSGEPVAPSPSALSPLSSRSIWFLAEDVLALSGKVDPNAVPVEVIPHSHANRQRYLFHRQRVAKAKYVQERFQKRFNEKIEKEATGVLDQHVFGGSHVLPHGAVFHLSCFEDPQELLRRLYS